jgi:magnesium chelatase subunit I
MEKLEKPNEKTPYDEVVSWFFEGEGFELLDDLNDADYKAKLNSVKPLVNLLDKYQADAADTPERYFMMEFILWGLVENKKLSKKRFTQGYQFKDLYGSYISGL